MVGHSVPAFIRRQHGDTGFPFVDQRVRDQRQEILTFQRVDRQVFSQISAEALFDLAHHGKLEAPEIHGDQRAVGNELFRFSFRVKGSAFRRDDVQTFLHAGHVTGVVHGADTAGDIAVFGQGVFNAEPGHHMMSRIRIFCQELINTAEGMLPVIIISVDHAEGPMDHIFCGKDRVGGTPGFGAFFGDTEAFRKVFENLMRIVNFDVFAQSAADFFFE